MLKITLALALSLVLTGCATPKYNYTVSAAIPVSEPPINSINTAWIGDRLVTQGTFFKQDYLVINAPTSVSGYTLLAGDYMKHGEDEKSGYFLPTTQGMVTKRFYMDPWKSIQAYKSENKLCVITVFNVATCEADAQYQLIQKDALTADTHQQTLIYSGKIGNRINIGYREFTSNIARAAFSNDVEYDLTESNIIGYKGARIEVIEANNEMIKYKVLKNFN